MAYGDRWQGSGSTRTRRSRSVSDRGYMMPRHRRGKGGRRSDPPPGQDLGAHRPRHGRR